MRLWLDDVRPMPPDFDVHYRTYLEAVRALSEGRVTSISFDHDLGDDDAGTGYDVACAIELWAYDGAIPRLTWAIHSANPVGRANIRRAMESADRAWDRREQGEQP